MRIKAPHAAFAEDDLPIPLGENVFGGKEKILDRGSHPPLQQNGLTRAPGALQERKVLHIPRADLYDVGVLAYLFHSVGVDGFGDNSHSGLFSCACEKFEAFEAHALE